MIWMERHDDSCNMHRFYAIEVSRDLFGMFVLTRRWGRAGQGPGQALVQSFATEAEAIEEKQTLTRAKFKRGYRSGQG